MHESAFLAVAAGAARTVAGKAVPLVFQSSSALELNARRRSLQFLSSPSSAAP